MIFGPTLPNTFSATSNRSVKSFWPWLAFHQRAGERGKAFGRVLEIVGKLGHFCCIHWLPSIKLHESLELSWPHLWRNIRPVDGIGVSGTMCDHSSVDNEVSVS